MAEICELSEVLPPANYILLPGPVIAVAITTPSAPRPLKMRNWICIIERHAAALVMPLVLTRVSPFLV